jgi:hypothetical protein
MASDIYFFCGQHVHIIESAPGLFTYYMADGEESKLLSKFGAFSNGIGYSYINHIA